VFLYDTHEKHGSARKCRRKFRDERVHSRQTVHNLMSKLRTTGPLIDKKQKHNLRVLTEKIDDTGGRLEHRTRKSLKRLAQETGVSNSIVRMATQFLRLRPCKQQQSTARSRANQLAYSFLQLVF
jgi:hypothetical protein